MLPTKEQRRGKRAHKFGQWAEKAVAKDLRQQGWTVRMNGAKGTIVDLIATKGGHRRYIQVKGSEAREPKMPSDEAIGRLLRTAHANDGTPVIALVRFNEREEMYEIEYISADTFGGLGHSKVW